MQRINGGIWRAQDGCNELPIEGSTSVLYTCYDGAKLRWNLWAVNGPTPPGYDPESGCVESLGTWARVVRELVLDGGTAASLSEASTDMGMAAAMLALMIAWIVRLYREVRNGHKPRAHR